MENKVDGITLLQMIKDGKIKDGTKIRMLFDGSTTNTILKYTVGQLIWEPGEFMVSQLYDDDFMFEIIEEIEKPKKIELLKIEGDDRHQSHYIVNECGTKCFLTKHSKMIVEQQNEIAKALNYFIKKEQEK